MACLIDAWRHIHLPSPPSPSASSHQAGCIREIKKICPSSYQNSLLQGMNNIDFLFMGDTHIRHTSSFFSLLAELSWFCACHPPPTGRLCARPVGGGPVRRLLYCRFSCGGARWQGDMVIRLSFGKFPSSGIITRC